MSARRCLAAVAVCLPLLMSTGAETASGDFKPLRSSRVESSTFFDAGKIHTFVVDRSKLLTLRARPVRRGLPQVIVASMKVRAPHLARHLMSAGGKYAFEMPTNEYLEDLSTMRVYVVENDKFVALLPKEIKAPVGTCSWGERLIDLNADGTVTIESWRVEGFDVTCEISRRHREVLVVAPDRTTMRIASSTTPWGQRGDSYGNDSWEREGNAIAFVAGLLVTNDGGGSYKLNDIATDATQFLPDALGDRLWEVAPDGRMISLQNKGKRPTTSLFESIAKPEVGRSLDRRNRISYFHFCGAKILEVVRRGKATRERKRSKLWRLTVRDSQGKALKTLKRQIRIGSRFAGCDSGYAHFAEAEPKRFWVYKPVAVRL